MKVRVLKLLVVIILMLCLFVPQPILASDLTLPSSLQYTNSFTYTDLDNSQFTDVVVHDFNDDGYLDFICSSFLGDQPGETNQMNVFLGVGDGTFSRVATYTIGTTSLRITLNDFNNDGIVDVAVSSMWSNSITVLIGNGDGTFDAPNLYDAGQLPYGIVSGDFNHDNNQDIAVTNNWWSCISILFGDGTGSFIRSDQTYSVGRNPGEMSTGDFNVDGNIDIVVANNYSPFISVLLGNSDGTFQSAISYSAGDFPCGVVSGDVNYDSFDDILVANERSGDVSVLLGNGNGTFNNAENYLTGIGSHALTLSDINRDGIIDVAVANFYDDHVSTLLGLGDGTFQSVNNNIEGLFKNDSIEAGDFNGDGAIDFVIANTGSVEVYLNNLPIQYTVLFNSNGGTPVSSISANYNTTVTAPTDPTKTGYIFAGWYKDVECTDYWDFATDKVTHDTILYAKWEYNFIGFFKPVDMNGVLNVAKAGTSIPIKFSLGGDMGLDIFEDGNPRVSSCFEFDNEIEDTIETITFSKSGLTYDPATDQYIYVWKTDKAWSGTCKQLVILFNDGTARIAYFKFK